MDPLRWARLEHVCFEALERPAADRPGFLEAACRDDEAFRRDVDSLIAQLTRDPHFLEQPVGDFKNLAPPVPVPEVPEQIGQYRIVRVLGKGGMGAVYLAEREADDVRPVVALKVILRGMDTEEVLARFRLERRILASLDHPNIARLIDAAVTSDGRPYFVMEYVEGLPLTEYCERHALPVDRRLQLFQVICGAVQHAHQHFVVHRDLKPRNILVTADGTPKLLDFGIGKVLEPAAGLGPAVSTRADARLLTPEYATPEQLGGRPVTTATDVYGLGLLLYEMLTGRHPYLSGGETLAEIEQAVTVTEPVAPSRATDRKGLAGDLDTIILKALRKEPIRRYPSAAALADDVQRHLDGLPVRARPDTFGYRAGKFLRRHRWPVAALATAFGALVATTGVTMVQSRRVAHEAARVTRERDKALEVRGFLLEMFGASGADRSVGDTVTVRRLLDLQAQQIDRAYAGQPEVQADMLDVLADGYDRLGIYQTAESLARRALDTRQATGNDPGTPASLNLLGWIIHERGRSKEALPMLLEAVALRRTLLPAGAFDLSRSLNDLGVVYNAITRYAAAESVLVEALAIRRAEKGDGHRSVGITANNLAAAYFYQSKLDSAIAVQQLAVAALGRSVGVDHQRSTVALGNLAAFKRASGDWVGAERDYRELLDRQSKLQGADHPVTARVRLSLGALVADRGAKAHDDSALAEAEGLLRTALESFEARLGPEHPQVGTALDRLAGVLAERGAAGAAVSLQERAVRLFRKAQGDRHAGTGRALIRLASLYRTLGNFADAERHQREAVAALRESLGPEHPETVRAAAQWCALAAMVPVARAECRANDGGD